MDGRYVGNGRARAGSSSDGRLSSYFKRRRAAVRFFIVSHKMPRIPEDCKYLEVFRSGKRVGAEVLSRMALGGLGELIVSPSPRWLGLRGKRALTRVLKKHFVTRI